jgi:cyclopropane-fatty-acyl-phospholipid synthase
MTAQIQARGGSLLDADRRFAGGGGWLARLVSGRFEAVLDRIDAGLVEGAIEAELPGGAARRLGGRAPGPVAVVRLNSWMPLVRLWRSGSVGWYRSWAAGEWHSPDPVPLFDLFMRNRVALGDAARAKGAARLFNRLAHALQRNDREGAARNIHAHYDLGNDFYAAWLDPGMTYSAAMFDGDDTLEAAQAHKIRALLDRLALKPGGRLLEIGCGWGSLAEVAARDYGVHVTGLTLSPGQKAYADARVARAGLGERVDIRLLDYRDVEGTFDAVASVEMVEAVGQDYWRDYLAAIARALKPGGRAALQYIAIAEDVFDDYARSADFIQACVFPGGMLLSESRFGALARDAGLGWADRTGFGLDYARTLECWRARFDRAVTEGRLPAGFDARFIDLWRYYLMYCEGGFRGGGIDVAQVTMTKRESDA